MIRRPVRSERAQIKHPARARAGAVRSSPAAPEGRWPPRGRGHKTVPGWGMRHVPNLFDKILHDATDIIKVGGTAVIGRRA